MKIKFNDSKGLLAVASAFLSTSKLEPEPFRFFMFEAEAGKPLSVYANCGQHGVKIDLLAQIEQPGRALVARDIASAVKGREIVDLIAKENKGVRINVSGVGGRTIGYLNPDSYPDFVTIPKSTLKMPVAALQALLSREDLGSKSTETQMAKLDFLYLGWEPMGGGTVIKSLVASQGEFGRSKVQVKEKCAEAGSAVIPLTSTKILRSLMRNVDGDIEIGVSNGKFVVAAVNGSIMAWTAMSATAKSFPADPLEKKFKEVKAGEIVGVLDPKLPENIRAFAGGLNDVVATLIKVANNQMTIVSQTSQNGSADAVATFQNNSGEDIYMAYDLRQMTSVLGSFPSGKPVTARLSGSNSDMHLSAETDGGEVEALLLKVEYEIAEKNAKAAATEDGKA